MGRKIEIKKIHDNTKRQVTFSKRRSSLMKKAEEVSIICDVDVAFLAFSPSGRISKFCNRQRMEDFLESYVNLPAEKRLNHVKKAQEKLEKLGTIRSEEGKMRYLDDQIQNLELQVKKRQIEVQIAEASLGDFEINPGQETSLYQLSWCERNLQHSIEKVKQKKKEIIRMENEGTKPWLNNSSSGQLQKQYVYPENIFTVMLGKGKGKEVVDAYGATVTTVQNNAFNGSMATAYGMHQFGIPETQTTSFYTLFQNNTFNATTPSSYAMLQPGTTYATKTSNELTFAPAQVNLNHGYTQQCGQNNASDMLWKDAPMAWQQAGSNSSFGNFSSENSNFAENYLPNYPFGFPPSYSNNVTNTAADASNCWEIPTLQNEAYPLVDVMDIVTDEEGNGRNNNKEDEDVYLDMIVSPPPSPPLVQATPSMPGDPSDLRAFFPLEDPLGGYTSLNKKIQDTHSGIGIN